MKKPTQAVDSKKIIRALLDNSQPFSPKNLHFFSDIQPSDLISLEKIWTSVDLYRRRSILEDLESLQETDTLLCFDDFAVFALKDDDPEVRSLAIRLLWESEDAHLIPRLIQLLENDPAAKVRAAAAGGLGKFVLLGETDELPPGLFPEIVDRLINVLKENKEQVIQLRALESLGYSSREDVIPFIQKACDHSEIKWLDSALLAMGRSANRRWENQVTEMLENPNVQIRTKATWAAGELELVSARKLLIDLAKDESEDDEVRLAAIWSLSQIGGEDAHEALEELVESCEDEDMAEILEEALDNLSFTDDLHKFSMIL